jgi:hypothetical protein
MFCRKCGNKISETDLYCQFCGTPTGYEKAPAALAEEAEDKEEIVFNPPYENDRSNVTEGELRFAGEETAATEKEEEDLKEFISENEVKEAHREQEDVGEPEPARDSEFTWNIHEFPSQRKKTEEIEFNWNMEDFSAPEQKEAAAASFEEELFQEITEESHKTREQNIDRFFTFSRKNEEFQELLDKEYEKFSSRFDPLSGHRAEQPAEESPAAALTGEDLYMAPAEGAPSEQENQEEEPPAAESVTLEEPPAEDAESGAKAASNHLSEMAEARAQFFGGDLIRDNESIKRKLESSDQAEPEQAAVEAPAEESPADEAPFDETFAEDAVAAGPLERAPAVEEVPALPEKVPASVLPEEPADQAAQAAQTAETAVTPVSIPFISIEGGEEEERRRWGAGQIALVVIAVILTLEIAILGIRYFAPESAAAKAVGEGQTQIFNTVSGWVDGIKDLFSGKDANEEAAPPEDSDKDPVADNTQDEQPAEAQNGAGTDTVTPDPNPAADKNALVASQMGNNVNIEQVRANEALAFQRGRNYGLPDINNSKPISNNIWQTPEAGTPIYYDRSVVGTIISFDSQWIDYVNGGGKGVLDLLKKDGEAYRKTAGFSKIGKITETFKLLEIGEIRQGANGFYVWVHEELQITENGKTTDKKYNWIYYLEPEEGKMKIVNYFKF